MHFDKINISKFRGIKELELEDCKTINIIVGKNNCCKTSVLEAIFLLSATYNPGLIVQIVKRRSHTIKENDLSFIFYKFNFSDPPEITARKATDAYYKLKIKPEYGNIRQPYSSDQFTIKIKPEYKNIRQPYSDQFTIAETDPVVNTLASHFTIKEPQREKIDFVPRVKVENGGGLSFEQPVDGEDKLRGVYITNEVFLSDHIKKELSRLIADKKLQKIIEALRLVDKNVRDISFVGDNEVYVDMGIDKLVPLSLAGDGLQRILVLTLALYKARGGILLIDEIETGFHFSVLESFWETVHKLANKFNVQIFATTHNIETLKSLNKRAKLKESFKKAVRGYAIDRNNKGVLKAFKYNFQEFNFAVEHDIEIR